jgi:hypothetical protein
VDFRTKSAIGEGFKKLDHMERAKGEVARLAKKLGKLTPYSKIKLPQVSQNSRYIVEPEPLSATCSFGFPWV